jgi:hypothetical protein
MTNQLYNDTYTALWNAGFIPVASHLYLGARLNGMTALQAFRFVIAEFEVIRIMR